MHAKTSILDPLFSFFPDPQSAPASTLDYCVKTSVEKEAGQGWLCFWSSSPLVG
jgi:hypothetical protein